MCKHLPIPGQALFRKRDDDPGCETTEKDGGEGGGGRGRRTKGSDPPRTFRGDISANNFTNEMSTTLIHSSICRATNLRLINELRRIGRSPLQEGLRVNLAKKENNKMIRRITVTFCYSRQYEFKNSIYRIVDRIIENNYY